MADFLDIGQNLVNRLTPLEYLAQQRKEEAKTQMMQSQAQSMQSEALLNQQKIALAMKQQEAFKNLQPIDPTADPKTIKQQADTRFAQLMQFDPSGEMGKNMMAGVKEAFPEAFGNAGEGKVVDLSELPGGDITLKGKKAIVQPSGQITMVPGQETDIQAQRLALAQKQMATQATRAGESSLQATVGKDLANRVSQSQDSARKSLQQDFLLDQVQLALSRGAQTGFGEESKMEIKKAMNSFIPGVDFDVSDSEMIRKVNTQLALELGNMQDTMLKGSTSNRDMDMLMAGVPGLMTTPGGNVKIIGLMKRTNQMQRDIAEESNKVLNASGLSVTEKQSRINDYISHYQLLTSAEKGNIRKFEDQVYDGPRPEIGTISEGKDANGNQYRMRYMGGNPGKEWNWEPVR